MKTILSITTACLLLSATSQAQEADTTAESIATKITITTDKDGKDGKDGENGKDGASRIAISPGGITVGKAKSTKEHKAVSVQYLMFDLGINALNDKTDYTSPAVKDYLNVPSEQQNDNLYNLRMSKSINVNLWPVIVNFKLANTSGQRVYLYSGAGMQFYNFRFNKNISHLNETNPEVIQDNVSFSKNKLSFAYASVPLMLNFQTKLAGKTWLVYGVGAIGGYAFDIWTKQISPERGKQKNHDQFNFNRFNLNLSAEIGIKNIIRFYGTYQVTNMYKNTMTQNPYCIGIRFFGV